MAQEPSGPSPSVRQPDIPTEACKLEEFYHSYAMHAFSIVLNEFPLKIKQIEAAKDKFDWQLIATIKPDTEWVHQFTRTYFNVDGKQGKAGRPARCISNSPNKPFLFDVYEENGCSMVPTNETIHCMVETIKPYISELASLTLQLSFAIELLEPKYQEGNNFGVEVQGKALSIVNDAYNTTQEYLDSLKNYYKSREQSLTSAMCNPHIADYGVCLTELDRAFMYTLCRCAEGLYSTYSTIHDVVTKNISKLRRPRDDDTAEGKAKPPLALQKSE